MNVELGPGVWVEALETLDQPVTGSVVVKGQVYCIDRLYAYDELLRMFSVSSKPPSWKEGSAGLTFTQPETRKREAELSQKMNAQLVEVWDSSDFRPIHRGDKSTIENIWSKIKVESA